MAILYTAHGHATGGRSGHGIQAHLHFRSPLLHFPVMALVTGWEGVAGALQFQCAINLGA